MQPSEARWKEIVAALRRGTVPRRGIEHLATGLDRFARASTRSSTRRPRAAGPSRPCAVTTAPGRPSSPAGCSTVRCTRTSRWRRCRSPRPRPRCTTSRPCTGARWRACGRGNGRRGRSGRSSTDGSTTWKKKCWPGLASRRTTQRPWRRPWASCWSSGSPRCRPRSPCSRRCCAPCTRRAWAATRPPPTGSSPG